MIKFLVLTLTLLTTASAWAWTPEAYPGYFWGEGSRSMNTIEGYGTMGTLSQGVQWTTLPGDIKFSTYAALAYRLRTENEDAYNSYAPTLGSEFSWKFLSAGAEYEWRTYPAIAQFSKDFWVYLSWYKQGDFFSPAQGKPTLLGIPVLGFPTRTWGQFFHSFSNLEGTGTIGWLSQGIDWFSLPEEIVFRTQGTYRWRFRTENELYYNAHGPAVGIELSRRSVQLGFDYSWMTYPSLGTTTNNWEAYLTWYFDWDLKKK